MSAFFVPNDPVPVVAPPPGALLAMPNLEPGADVFGATDVLVTMTGLPTCERLEVYVDDSKYVEAMSKISGNRFVQTIETSVWPDGKHRIAVCVRDAKNQILAATAREVFFRNVGNVHVMSVLPTVDDDGFSITLRVNALRTQLEAASFAISHRAAGNPSQPLALSLEYRGDEINGIPVATMLARLPAGQTVGTHRHDLSLILKDNTGATSAWTEFRYTAPRE